MYFFALFLFDFDHLGVFETDLSRSQFKEDWNYRSGYQGNLDDFWMPVMRDGAPHTIDILESLSDKALYLTESAALGAGKRFQKDLKRYVRSYNRALHSKKRRKRRQYNIE